MTDALFCFGSHPCAIAAHVFGQAFGTGPVFKGIVGGILLAPFVRFNLRSHWLASSKLGRNLDHRLVDGHRHRVEVGGVSFQPQALGFQRQRPTAGKRIVEGRQFFGIE